MNPKDIYRQQLAQQAILPDPAQAEAVDAFQALYERLLHTPRKRPGGLLAKLRKRRIEPITGLYLWGGVGRGKTWLMDLFYQGLPLEKKHRVHFHRFMHSVHQRLKKLKGQADPLQIVARDIAAETELLCLDEFQVWDIGDAMILGGLLEALFEQGLCLVATSNCAPPDLYPNGLQRSRFLPAIESLQTHTQVIELASETDYRLRTLQQAGTYHTPVDENAEQHLLQAFQGIAPETGEQDVSIDINDRPMKLIRHADSVAWLSFDTLCRESRSQSDYLELARCYHSVLISGIPAMNDGQNDAAKRFIHLVDVLYDHNVSLVASAEAQPEELYNGRALAFEFQRTASRLQEMQSSEWLERPHLGQ